MNNSWIRIEEAADILELDKRSVMRRIKKGKCIARKVPSIKHKGKFVTEIDIKSLGEKYKREKKINIRKTDIGREWSLKRLIQNLIELGYK